MDRIFLGEQEKILVCIRADQEKEAHIITVVHLCKSHFSWSIKLQMRRSSYVGQRSGVYKLQCLHCPAFYIGETSRKFKTRSSEHKPTLARIQSADENSSRFAIHLNTTGHPFHGRITHHYNILNQAPINHIYIVISDSVTSLKVITNHHYSHPLYNGFALSPPPLPNLVEI